MAPPATTSPSAPPPFPAPPSSSLSQPSTPPSPTLSTPSTTTTTAPVMTTEEPSPTAGQDKIEQDLEKHGAAVGTASAPAPAPVHEFPDGGWRAWLVVAGGFCVSFTVWGYTTFGVYQSHYKIHQLSSRSPSDISWIGSFQLSMVLACAVVSGKAFDSGYIKYLLGFGTLLYTAGLFGLSYAGNYTQIFLAQGVACGVAAGICFLPAVSSVSHWFRLRRATALGILACGSSVGGVVYPLLLNKNFERIGFEKTVQASGYLTVGLLVIAFLTINTRLPPRVGGPVIDFRHFKDLDYCLFVAGESLIMWGLYMPYYYIQTYALSNGVAPNIAQYSLSILNAASLFGRIIPNWLADTYGPFTILTPNCFISAILIFAFISMCKTTAGTVVFCVLFGFSSGAYVSMMPACVASITTNMNQIGIRIAMAFLIISLFALTGTPISGAIVTAQGGKSYVGTACTSGVMVLLGTGFNAAAWWVLRKRRGTNWV